MLGVGDLLGKYQITRELGEGGMARVFAARHVKLGHEVAVKVLLERYADDAVIAERFDREAHALSRLKSRHVVRVIDVDVTADGAPYLVMEHLDGNDLEVEIAHRGALPAQEAARIVAQVCAGIEEAHTAGLVHRDLKPSNVFLTNEADGRVARVLDFGIAMLEEEGDARLTKAESVVGTPLYMAPELFRGARQADARSDVWALGATLYEALSGRPPFAGPITMIGIMVVNDPLPRIDRADIPQGLETIVRKALEKDPAQRFPSAAALGAALERFATNVEAVKDIESARTLAAAPISAVLPDLTKPSGVAAVSAASFAETPEAVVSMPREADAKRRWPLVALGAVALGAITLGAITLGGPKARPLAAPPAGPASVSALASTSSIPAPASSAPSAPSSAPASSSSIPAPASAVSEPRKPPGGRPVPSSKPPAKPSGNPLFFEQP